MRGEEEEKEGFSSPRDDLHGDKDQHAETFFPRIRREGSSGKMRMYASLQTAGVD